MSSEDLHRAFQLLKFHLRHPSTAKSSNSFYGSTHEQNQQCVCHGAWLCHCMRAAVSRPGRATASHRAARGCDAHGALKPWQVTAVAWAVNQEQGPLRGGMIADACGIGKTIQMLSIIVEGAARDAEHSSLHPRPPLSHTDALDSSIFRPTLILCPAPVIEVWDSEVRSHFPQLRIMRWYDTPDKQSQKHIRDAILPTKAPDFLDWMKTQCPSDQPKSAYTVIISSYDTFTYSVENQTGRPS